MHRLLDSLVFGRGMRLAFLRGQFALVNFLLGSPPVFQRTAFGASFFFVKPLSQRSDFDFFIEMPSDRGDRDMFFRHGV